MKTFQLTDKEIEIIKEDVEASKNLTDDFLKTSPDAVLPDYKEEVIDRIATQEGLLKKLQGKSNG